MVPVLEGVNAIELKEERLGSEGEEGRERGDRILSSSSLPSLVLTQYRREETHHIMTKREGNLNEEKQVFTFFEVSFYLLWSQSRFSRLECVLWEYALTNLQLFDEARSFGVPPSFFGGS